MHHSSYRRRLVAAVCTHVRTGVRTRAHTDAPIPTPMPVPLQLPPASLGRGGLHLVGEVAGARDFEQPSLFCRWQVRVGVVSGTCRCHGRWRALCLCGRTERYGLVSEAICHTHVSAPNPSPNWREVELKPAALMVKQPL
eukprot:366320-Chlamydomonas_euryale.AAC.5